MVQQYELSSRGVGTIQRNIYEPWLQKITVPVPPLDEQREISVFLSSKCAYIESLIVEKDSLIKDLIAYRHADDVKDKKSIAEVESLEEECDFCVYDDIRDKLIAKGIPAEEIAYIHDAKTEQQKADLFDKVRSGEIRVLLGSTAKMGTGTNVQKKLIAVHDLDIPWRPADVEHTERNKGQPIIRRMA